MNMTKLKSAGIIRFIPFELLCAPLMGWFAFYPGRAEVSHVLALYNLTSANRHALIEASEAKSEKQVVLGLDARWVNIRWCISSRCHVGFH